MSCVSSPKKERDYKRQCHMFTDQINVLQQRILEMNNKYVKKETCHQSTETDAVFLLKVLMVNLTVQTMWYLSITSLGRN